MDDLNALLADLTSGDEPRAEAAAVRFVSLGEPAFYALAALYASPDPEVRWWAVRALNEFAEERVSSLLILAVPDWPQPSTLARNVHQRILVYSVPS